METGGYFQTQWLLIGLFVFLALCYFLAPVLTPFFAGALIAYLGDPLLDQLEKWRLNRTLGVFLVFAFFFIVALIFILLLIPMVHRQVEYLSIKLPLIINWLQKVAFPKLEENLGITLTSFDLLENKDLLLSAWQYSGDYFQGFLKNLSKSGMAVFAFLANLALVPIVAFYLLRDWDILMVQIRSLIPRQ